MGCGSNFDKMRHTFVIDEINIRFMVKHVCVDALWLRTPSDSPIAVMYHHVSIGS